MNEVQRKAALESMREWLSHPAELGKPPAKIECAGEFDLHEMHYYIFKFKKSLLSPQWLIGVCGGYEGNSLEHCGHVFSKLEPYNPDTAEQDAKEIVEDMRQYYMKLAEDLEKSTGTFLSFVLLNSEKWDKDAFAAEMNKLWGIELSEVEGDDEEEDDEPDNAETFVASYEGMLAAAAYIPAPIPDGEAEKNAETNYLWPEAVTVTRGQKAHVIITVMPGEGNSAIDAGKMLVKMCAASLQADNAIGVYTSGTVFEPGFYSQAANVMKDGELPYLNWLYFGIRQSRETGLYSGYTYGLASFGRLELEVLNTDKDPNELRGFLFNIAAYIISSDVVLHDGETLGFSADEKLTITKSEGVNLEGMTLKIGW